MLDLYTRQTESAACGRLTAPLRIRAVAAVGGWGITAESFRRAVAGDVTAPTDGAAGSLPFPPGFVESLFNPLVHEVGRQCLEAGAPDGERTAVILASVMGDATTADLSCRRLTAGQHHQPLMFLQSVSNSVLGVIGATFGVTGPMSSIAPWEGVAGELLLQADLALAAQDIDHVLVIGAELPVNERTEQVYRHLHDSGSRVRPPAEPTAVALLLERPRPVDRTGVVVTAVGPDPDLDPDLELGFDPDLERLGDCGGLTGLVRLAAAAVRQGGRDGTEEDEDLLVRDPHAPVELTPIRLQRFSEEGISVA